ncbi:hypothetical protein BHE74_00012277 [Ensete ventricosum]|nr:hypothetical protein BHE74_00012277 [Ensete ventricosum]
MNQGCNFLQEWNAPKPMHLSLLRDALERNTSIGQQSELWAPLAPQGWKPCIESTSTSCKCLYGIAAISPFSHRLAFENLSGDIQRLRCKVNFQALAFVSHINALGETLIKRLRSPVRKQPEELLKEVADENVQEGPGKFAVLHLRFDKVYGGEARISSLRKLFPLMDDKRSLASEEELAKVEGKASLLAAVDYHVSMHSDIFISASPGNMHNAVVSISPVIIIQ